MNVKTRPLESLTVSIPLVSRLLRVAALQCSHSDRGIFSLELAVRLSPGCSIRASGAASKVIF
jgi:hypothetical protein